MFIFMLCALSALLRVDMCLVAVIIIIIIIIIDLANAVIQSYVCKLQLCYKLNTCSKCLLYIQIIKCIAELNTP